MNRDGDRDYGWQVKVPFVSGCSIDFWVGVLRWIFSIRTLGGANMDICRNYSQVYNAGSEEIISIKTCPRCDAEEEVRWTDGESLKSS